MVELGYTLSSEEHGPNDLVRYAVKAEEAGFEFAVISDHYHPWIETQGESPFVWGTLGGIAQATDALTVGTGVTCPTMRIHPVIIAQAAATAGAMFDGRFFLGVGTGERLNEHITAQHWPAYETRSAMLEEAVEVIRSLWNGEMQSHHGEYFTVENAQLFTRPEEPPDIGVAAGGTDSAALAGRIGDALISTAPSREVVEAFHDMGDNHAPAYGQVTVCWGDTEEEARNTAHRWWPNTALPGELGQELATPAHFHQAVELVTIDDVAEKIPCGPDPDTHIDAIETFIDAGFENVYLHQVGPQQAGFIEFCRDEILPAFS